MANIQKYNLSDEDLLYFLHIPKTAGTTMISILDSQYNAKKILNLHEWQELLPLMPIDFTKYDFIRGHFGRSIFGLLPKKPICVTILRDPIKLMISSYKMVARQPKEKELYSVEENQTISDLITDPKRFPLTNRQAHHIVAKLDIQSLTKDMTKEEVKKFFPHHLREFYLPEMSDEELFENAKTSILNDFAFFGIVEKMEKSLFLLHYTFGWMPIRDTVRENISPKNQNSELSEEAMEKLSEMTKVDQKLYDYANEIFDSRYSQMVEELKEKYYEQKFEKMESNDVVFEMLKLDHKQKKKDKGRFF
jgi:hypothetical protein